MKKKNYISGFLIALLIILTPGCNDYLDINKNPNYLTEANLTTLMASSAATTIAQLGYNGTLMGNMWMQYTTQGNSTNQYNSLVNYSLTTTSYPDMWINPYANTLSDLKAMLEMAEEENACNFWLIGKVLTAYNYHILTDFYEDIPLTEALQAAEFPNPKYDDSKTSVYPSILSFLDEAIAKESEAKSNTNPLLTNADYYFNGNIDKWVAFAKSLKLKLMLRDFDSYRTQITTLLESGGLLEEDCAFTAFEDATNKGNPLYEYNIRQLNTQENIRASHTFLEFLLAYDDPRIEEIYEVTTYASQRISNGEQLTNREKYEGLPTGARPSTQEADAESVPLVRSSRYKQAYSDPVYLMNSAEALFLQAEAFARLGQTERARQAYEKGVENAFARWNLDASSFIASGGAYEFDGSSLDTMLKCILLQKWAAGAKANSWDVWFDRNRTGIPAISDVLTVRVSNQSPGLTPGYQLGTLVPPGATVLQPKEIPRRLLLPTRSTEYNKNAPETKRLPEPMWWQVPDGQ